MAKGLQRAFSLEVRALRVEQGLTQEELADRAEVHVNYVGMIERCERSPTLPVIEGIARGLGVKVSELLRRAENRNR